MDGISVISMTQNWKTAKREYWYIYLLQLVLSTSRSIETISQYTGHLARHGHHFGRETILSGVCFGMQNFSNAFGLRSNFGKRQNTYFFSQHFTLGWCIEIFCQLKLAGGAQVCQFFIAASFNSDALCCPTHSEWRSDLLFKCVVIKEIFSVPNQNGTKV